jgi:predicted transcriptional regulator
MDNKKLSCVEQSVLPLMGSIDEEQVQQIVARVLPKTVDQQQVTVQVIIQYGVDQATMDQRFQQQRQQIKQDMQEIVGQTEAREVKRDERLHKRVDFIRSVVMFLKRHVVKISLSVAGLSASTWTIFYHDVLFDLAKEVIKIVAENKLDAIATGIQLGLSSIIDPAAPVMVPVLSVLLPEFALHRKTATALLQVAAFSLNHTVLGWPPVRRGLAFIRSIFASK